MAFFSGKNLFSVGLVLFMCLVISTTLLTTTVSFACDLCLKIVQKMKESSRQQRLLSYLLKISRQDDLQISLSQKTFLLCKERCATVEIFLLSNRFKLLMRPLLSKTKHLMYFQIRNIQELSYLFDRISLVAFGKSTSFLSMMLISTRPICRFSAVFFVPTFGVVEAKDFARIARLKLRPRMAFTILIPGIPNNLSCQREKLVTSHQQNRFS